MSLSSIWMYRTHLDQYENDQAQSSKFHMTWSGDNRLIYDLSPAETPPGHHTKFIELIWSARGKQVSVQVNSMHTLNDRFLPFIAFTILNSNVATIKYACWCLIRLITINHSLNCSSMDSRKYIFYTPTYWPSNGCIVFWALHYKNKNLMNRIYKWKSCVAIYPTDAKACEYLKHIL